MTKEILKACGVKINLDVYMSWIILYSIKFNITLIERIKCFFANVLHETGNFYYQEEIASGVAYEGRKDLGNTVKGDGVKFKGRGFGQLTGRSNYTAFNTWCKNNIENFTEDFILHPEKLLIPQYCVLSAFWFWKINNLEKYADLKDFRNVCSVWNTGKINSKIINGIDKRISNYNLLSKYVK